MPDYLQRMTLRYRSRFSIGECEVEWQHPVATAHGSVSANVKLSDNIQSLLDV
jgi:hypothetical protein